jgi:hypothetical protein
VERWISSANPPVADFKMAAAHDDAGARRAVGESATRAGLEAAGGQRRGVGEGETRSRTAYLPRRCDGWTGAESGPAKDQTGHFGSSLANKSKR